MLRMDLEYNDGVLFVRLKGKLKRNSSYKLNNYLNPVLLKHKVKYLVCNLYDLNYVDRVGINALLNTKWIMKLNKGKFYICDVPDEINEDIKTLKVRMLKDELQAKRMIEI